MSAGLHPPRFSIALPVHNGERFLREALDSVLAQSFADFELVLSDNNSSDATAEVCRAAAAEDARVKVYRSEETITQTANINRVVSLCCGEWVKFLCHDDILRPQCLEVVDAVLRTHATPTTALVSNSEAWLFANGYLHDPDCGGDGSVRVWNGREYVAGSLRGIQPVGLPALTTATVRRAAWFTTSGFDEREPVAGDVYYWTRLLLDWDYAAVDRVLTVNRIHGGQVAVRQRRESRRQLQACRRFYLELLRDTHGTLELSSIDQLRTRLRYVALAGTNVAIRILIGDARGALHAAAATPPPGLPLLPFFVMRSLVNEGRKLKGLRSMVPATDIYPA